MLGQRLQFSITKLLSHLEIIEDLDSDYEKRRFFIIRDSFNVCILELSSSAGIQGLPPKCVLPCQVILNRRCQTHAVYRTFLSLCGSIVFGPYILRNPRAKSNNSIPVLNTLYSYRRARHHPKHVPNCFYRNWKPTKLRRTEYSSVTKSI